VPEREAILVGLGVALRETRQDRGLSQEELGLRTGVHRNYIGGMERAERSPTVLTVAKLADALGMTVSELFLKAERSA